MSLWTLAGQPFGPQQNVKTCSGLTLSALLSLLFSTGIGHSRRVNFPSSQSLPRTPNCNRSLQIESTADDGNRSVSEFSLKFGLSLKQYPTHTSPSFCPSPQDRGSFSIPSLSSLPRLTPFLANPVRKDGPLSPPSIEPVAFYLYQLRHKWRGFLTG